jgi:hypothetical protein
VFRNISNRDTINFLTFDFLIYNRFRVFFETHLFLPSCTKTDNPMKWLLCLTTFAFSFLHTCAQTDPEFPKGWVMYLEAQQGMATTFNSSPDIYVFSLGLAPAATVIPGHLRLGGTANLLYTNKNISAAFGPRAAWKIKTFNIDPLGSLFNLQLQVEHLWGTDKQKLFGGGPVIEAGQILSFSLTAHRDYCLNYWWFRAGLGFNLLHKKRKSPTGTDPMRDNP